MGKLNRIAGVFALALLTMLNVSAQALTFDDATLIELRKISAQEMEDRNMRIVTLTEMFENDNKTPVEFEKFIREFVPPDRERSIFETKTANGIERTEYIDIGANRFVKHGDGKWEKFVATGSGMTGGEGNGSGDDERKIETTVIKRLKKGEVVNNRTVDCYERVVTHKYIYPAKTYTNTFTDAFWFDADGKLIKALSESNEGEKKRISRTIWEYEYDPKLKIEAPIIKTGTKRNREKR